MKIFMRFLVLAVVAILALPAWAGTIQINDLEETGILVYLDGIRVTDNITGVISNWLLAADNETVTFTFNTSALSSVTGTYYTPILESDSTLSDLFVVTATLGSPNLDVAFYSDGSATFPTIGTKTAWIDLTGITAQGLSNPFYEDGTYQLVATYFGSPTAADGNFVGRGPVSTQFYMASDVPEPATLGMFIGAGLLLAAYGARKVRR